MIPIEGMPVLTAAQMRAAEERSGAEASVLMERAGHGIAAAVHRLAAGAEVFVLCGPGNNGGDGYAAARAMATNGMAVRVAASGEPKGAAAVQARAGWAGAVEAFPDALPEVQDYAPIVVDAVFGTGLSRPLDNPVMQAVHALADHARLSIAIDLPSGVVADTGEQRNAFPIPGFDLTLALGALKPAHLLQPSADRCGTVRLIDIGLGLDNVPHPRERVSSVWTIERPRLPPPGPWSHKFSRGMVAVVAGAMHGASELAAAAAYRAGAGYVLLSTGGLPQQPHAIVRKPWNDATLDDRRIGAVVIGPGLGRDDRARARLAVALASPHPLVIDGDALHLIDPDALSARAAVTILTPHAGEFTALFGETGGDKIARTRAAARRTGAVVVHKGADTVIARPDGWANVATQVAPYLAVAGTGDVLAGTIGALLTQRAYDPLGAASDGVWLHTQAARRLAGPFIADDLVAALPAAVASVTKSAR